MIKQLNAHHTLRRLFLKDPQLKKAQLTPSCPIESCEVIFKGKIKTSNEIVASNEGYRKVRHSAAMIGLALSMGATGILLPKGDQAVLANEPNADELSLTHVQAQEYQIKEVTQEKISPVVETNLSSPEYSTPEKVSPTSAKAIVDQTNPVDSEGIEGRLLAPTLNHEVKEGETLWQLSQDYQVTPEAIAMSNEINPEDTIIAGETLDIPAENGQYFEPELEPELQSTGTQTDSTLSSAYGVETQNIKPTQTVNLNQPLPQGETVTITEDVDALLKQQQESALQKLEQEKNELQNQLMASEIAIITPESIDINVLEQNQGFNPSNNSNSALEIEGIKATGEGYSNETALNIPSVDSPESATIQNPSTIIPETALLPGNANVVDFHNFTEPIAIPVPLPGVQEQNLSSSTNQNTEHNSGNITTELNQIPIPVSQPIAFVTASPQLYTVRQGDTLDSIASDHGISTSELMEENNLSNPHLIKVNQQLRFPQEQGLNSTRTQETVGSIQENALSSNASLPTPTTFVDRDNSSENGVEKMTADLNRLRDSAQIPTSNESSNVIALNPSSSFNQPIYIPVEPYRSVNPDGPENSSITPSTPTVQPTTEPVQPVQARVNTPIQQQPEQLIAAAPIATSNYNPMFQLPIGQTVSPELPGLAGADQYLPNASARFEGYIWPSKGVLTSGYGWRWGRMHKGIDIAAPIGTPIVAAAPGEVIFSGWNSGGYGNLVKIKHDDGSLTLYAHNNRLLVRSGQYVDQGQQIAEMGSTGRSTGPHLHFEIHPSGNGAVNPVSMLPRR
jgi:murein DD-endopeptidase MepM/ murein hydrolase activator NlpD